MRLLSLISGVLLLAPGSASAAQAEVLARLTSPDGRIEVVVDQGADGGPRYAVSRDGRPILAPSALGLDLDKGGLLGPALRTEAAARTTSGRDDYRLLGRQSRVQADWRELQLSFAEQGPAPRRLQLTFRAYDDGVAFRYTVPTDAGLEAVGLKAEATLFAFPADYRCWGLNLGRFNTAHEGEFDPIAASRIRDHNAYDAPLVCETGGEGPAFAIAEADLRDYAGLYLSGRGDGGPGLQVRLAPRPDDPQIAVRSRIGSPLRTPWRVVMIGDRAGDLIASPLVTNLNPDPAFDAAWVRPGKSAWDWWNGGQIAAVPGSGMNTATFKAFIDFAAANGLQYVMIDEGWCRGAGGAGVVRTGVDVTRSIPEMDIPALVAYGRERGVGVILWLNWKALDAQFDAALDQYQAWGVAGLKVDFMDRDDQLMVDWYHRLLSQAAEHRLLVDLHGAYHPTGLTRTYPNFVTQEGVLGAEYNKWSARVTASHNVTLPYTRMLVGPMDYTPGGFRNVAPEAFSSRFILPTVMTTRAHGLAMFVVYESPLTVVADTPDAYRDQPETAFIAGVPTTWDETRFLDGEIGQSIVLARRKGGDWYLGAMTNEQGRRVSVPLAFLGGGRFEATIYADGDSPAQTRISKRIVTARETLDLSLAASGGAAVRITPVSAQP
ncbi:MAG: glycoside hydrolase family 97 protein [Brevundimonas sp.]